ncbi:Peroxisomal membrane protein PMP27 [Fusarium chlamydosporum]
MNKNVAFIVSQISDIRFTTKERDVLLRFLVFSSRLATWVLSQNNAPAATISRWQLLMRQLSLTAKLLRVGKFMQQFKSAAQNLSSKKHQDHFLGYMTVIRQLLTAVYMTCDNATVLNSIGFVPWKGAKTLERRAFRIWFAAGVCGIVAQLYCFYQLNTGDDEDEDDRQSLL